MSEEGQQGGEVGSAVAAACAAAAPPPFDLTTLHIPAAGDEGGADEACGFFLPLGGGMVKLKGTGRPGAAPPGGRRGVVSEFSRASRRRLLQTMASLDRSTAPPLFVGLTYPGSAWPDDYAVVHEHLAALWRRLERRYPALRLAVVWRLEPQERGAPHFHLLIFGLPFLPYGWLAAAWSEIVGGDEAHRRSCSRVERVRSWRGAMSYASKYLGKSGDGAEFRDSAGVVIQAVGRHWGVKGRANLPVTWVRYAVGLRQFHQVRRVLAGLVRSKGRRHQIRGRYAGVWCFMLADEALRLVGLVAPEAVMTYEAPQF